MNSALRWGVLGTGTVVRRAVLPALLRMAGGQVLAVASSDPDRAHECATAFSLPRAYGQYQALLDDPEISCVYLALPNHLHAQWTMRAAQAGKHILCEKPLAPTVVEVETMTQVCEASGIRLMEALMYRFHPRTARVHALLTGGAVGAVQAVSAAFTFPLSAHRNYRWRPECGGGALLDVGSYCVSATRALLGAEPIAVHALASYGESGVDESLMGLLAFPAGMGATITCSFRAGEHQRVTVLGSKGVLELPLAFTAWHQDEASIVITRDGRVEVEKCAPADPYQLTVERFAAAVLSGEPIPYPLQETLATTRVLEALARSARTGESQALPAAAADASPSKPL